MKTFFISDLHLSKAVPSVIALFHHFLDQIFTPGDQLFILGDFFEYYLGRDLLDPEQQRALAALKQRVEQGSKVYFMPGNRDFLLDSTALAPYHIQFLADPTLIQINNTKVLLTHGDTLCTLDKQYQRYRKLVRLKIIEWLFLNLPRNLRQKIAKAIHNKNPHRAYVQDPSYKLADATPEAINKMIEQHHPDLFIYGHVHKMEAALHGVIQRLVLGDWYHTGNYIEFLSLNKIKAEVFSLPT